MISNELIPLLIPVIMGLAALIPLFFHRRRLQEPIPLLQAQADRLGGRVQNRVFGFKIYYEFERFGTQVRMRCQRGRGSSSVGTSVRSPATIISAEIETPIVLRLKVNKSARGGFNKTIGLDKLETGNTTFDRSFGIQSNDKQFAIEFMDSDMQSLMLALTDSLKWPPQISVSLGELELRSNYIFKDPAEFEAIADGFIAMLERLSKMQIEGETG